MRKITIALNAFVALFFGGFLTYTFVARQHLDGLARDFVTEKTLHYSKPIVDLADETLNSPLVKKLLAEEQIASIRHEIAEYRRDAPGYIADLTRQKMLAPNPQNANPLLEKVTAIKGRIRTFYDNTLAALIADLQVFSTSNLCAAGIALWLVCRSRGGIQKSIVWFSFLMFIAVIFCSYLYIDDLTFFRILFRAHIGWWYPVFLCVALAFLYLQYGRTRHATKSTGEL